MVDVTRYKVILWWSEKHQTFLATMPALPGAMADGPTQDAALANLRDVAQVWIEAAQEDGEPIPQPESESLAA